MINNNIGVLNAQRCKTDCNHYGCQSCFIKLNDKCPYCRQDINEYYKISKI